jgi:hypothetical protein
MFDIFLCLSSLNVETGRKVHERKLSSLMKKMKDSCKLDINQSVPENILSHPEVKRKQCGGDRYYANIFIYTW